MKNKSIVVLMTLAVAFSILMASCAAPQPEVVTVQETVVVEKEVVVERKLLSKKRSWLRRKAISTMSAR